MTQEAHDLRIAIAMLPAVAARTEPILDAEDDPLSDRAGDDLPVPSRYAGYQDDDEVQPREQ